MKHYWSNVTSPWDHDDTVLFSGSNDTLTFARGSGDTVIANGTDQTVMLAGTGPDTVVDHGHGLNIAISQVFGQITVEDFQNDPTAKVTLIYATGKLSPDGHGGTLLSITGNG